MIAFQVAMVQPEGRLQRLWWLAACCIILITTTASPTAAASPCRSSGKGVIIDTDMEIDDVGAVLLAFGLEQRGEARVLAMGLQGPGEFDPATLDAIDTYYGRGDIPLGMRLEGQYQGKQVDHFDHFHQYIAEHFPNKFTEGKRPSSGECTNESVYLILCERMAAECPRVSSWSLGRWHDQKH